VTFNGSPAAFVVDSDVQITATVPVGASTGPIAVTNPAGTGTSAASFTVVAADCSNALDDDGDGLTDFPDDPGCQSSADSSERAPALVCDDGVDADGDGFTDHPADPGCGSPSGNRENPQCQDGLDNDGDGATDFDGGASLNGGTPVGPVDGFCSTASLDRERKAACGLGFEAAFFLGPLLGLRGLRRRRA
jgi:hypothetical protein